MARDESISNPSLPGPWGTNCCVPGLLCSSSCLPFQSELLILPVLFEVCFSFLSSTLLLGWHKWPWNSVLTSSSSLSYLLEVEVQGLPPPGWWSLWSLFPAVPAVTWEQNSDMMVFHQPHLSWDVCVWCEEAVMLFIFRKGWIAPLPIKVLGYP